MFTVVFFRMFCNKEIFRRSSIKYWKFSEGPTWSENRHKLSKNCSIHGKNRESSGPYNFWTPMKSNIPDVWNWNFCTLFGSEIEVGERRGPWTPCTTPSGYFPARKCLNYIKFYVLNYFNYFLIYISGQNVQKNQTRKTLSSHYV